MRSAEALYTGPDWEVKRDLYACDTQVASRGERADQAETCRQRLKKRYRASQAAVAAFNSAWLPVIHRAVSLGDPIAEVILRDCETTPILDRRAIDSTCGTPDQQEPALVRLRAIGFAPAIPWGFPDDFPRGPDRRATGVAHQLRTLVGMRGGALGVNLNAVASDGNVFGNDMELQWYRNGELMAAVLQDSGGLTYLPDSINFVTPLGNGYVFNAMFDEARKKFTVLNPHDRYKQVLMECKGAEWPDSDRGRFLLHARNYMVEISGVPGNENVSIRLYKKTASSG